MKRRVCVLLTCLLLLVVFTVTAAAAEPQNSFVLTVSLANSVVVEPERIPYTSGQTIKEALLASGHTFDQLEEQNFIGAVDGVAGNYVILYDGGGYEVSAPASSITAMRIGVISVNKDNREDMLNLVRRMAEYRYMENHVQNYPDAQSAYKECLSALRGDGSAAATAQEQLDNAIAAYEAILAGPKYTVTVNATKGEETVSTPLFTLTDAYGNVTSGQGSTLQVIAGDYTFCVSDGGYNRTEGSIKVRSGLTVAVELPTGEWFGKIYMREYDATTGYRDPYISERDDAHHTLTVQVNDAADPYYGLSTVFYQGEDIPDTQTTKLHSIYTSLKGEDMSERHIMWSSDSTDVYGVYLPYLIEPGLEGRTFCMEASYVNDKGHTQIQSFTIIIQRVPTLQLLAVYADGARLRIGAEAYTWSGHELPFDRFFIHKWEYSAATTSDTLDIVVTAFSEDYTIEGDGSVSVTSGSSDHLIRVSAPSGETSEYVLHVQKEDGVKVTLALPDNTTGQVFTDTDSEIKPLADGSYRLIAGQTYYYVGTTDTYYHTKGEFIAQEGLQVTVVKPIVEDWLEDFGAYSGSRAIQVDDTTWGREWFSFRADEAFSSDVHECVFYPTISDNKMYLQATVSTGTPIAHYTGQSMARPYAETLTIDKQVGEVNATEAVVFLSSSGYSAYMTLQIEQSDDSGVTYYQEYRIKFFRQLELYELKGKSGTTDVVFESTAGEKIDFDRDVHDYIVTVDRDAEEVVFSGRYLPQNDLTPKEYIGGFYAIVNGQKYDEVLEFWNPGFLKNTYFADVTIPLSKDQDEEIVTIGVYHADPTSVPATYTLKLQKSDPVPVEVKAVPSDLLVFMTSDLTGNREYDKDGVFMLTPGRTYTYNATRVGYVGQTGTLTVPENGGTLEITLEQVPENSTLVNLPAQWPHLRTDNNNNGVISARTPISSDDTVLYWATKIGDGFDQDACSPPIIVNDDLYVYSGSAIFRVNKTTGEIMATGAMCGTSSFAINPPTYANGMIFVGLSRGRVQAFNASTLESLWIYTDPLGGQPNCPIVYHDGHVYTGFWSGEDKVNNYVCLTATDEDPSNTLESKIASWTYSSRGGFYWSGAYVCDQFTLIGTDDGEVGYTTGHAHLLSLDTSTGKPIDDVTMDETGDIRSSITQYNGKYYFTSKGGYFYEASVDGSGVIQNIRKVQLSNGGSSSSTPAMSTSTPTIYNGRAYIGVSGTGQFTAYSGHNITVIDLAYMETAYSVQTQGYPQTSGVLTTAYAGDSQTVYVYFFDNYTPGKLRVLKDEPGQTSAELTSDEYGITTALNLFEPCGDHAQYAICSPVVDSDGTIYFKNDSAYLMAVGSTVDTLEVTQPTKLDYKEGETFDPTGLHVIAHFKNGIQKDVTEYMTWSTEPLTEADTDFQLLYPVGIYQNKDGEAGQAYQNPVYSLTLTIQKAEPEVKYGDVNGDGKITAIDAIVLLQYTNRSGSLDDRARKAADVNGDGKISPLDALVILQYCNRQITSFPVG